MGRTHNSHLGVGTGISTQGSFEQGNVDSKIIELQKNYNSFNSSSLSYEESKNKIANYLLDLNNQKGKSKAKFFIEVLGYSSSNPKEFFDNLSKAIDGKIPLKVKYTEYGEVLEFHEKIEGTNGRIKYANIIIIVQKDNGKTNYRIITAYPDKKERGK